MHTPRRTFIKQSALLAASLGLPNIGQAAAVPAAVRRANSGESFIAPPGTDTPKPFRLGTMYWLNPNYGETEIERDVLLMKENGFELIRSFLFWRNIETSPGVFDFRRNDMLHAAAAKHGLKIMETFEIARYPFNETAPEPTLHNIEQAKMCLDRPDAMQWTERFVKAAVEHFKDSPALEIWNLNNEPVKTPCLCEHTLKKFAAWLRGRYKDTATMRRAHTKEFGSRIPVMPSSLETLDAPELKTLLGSTYYRTTCLPLLFDFHDFATDNLCDNIRWIGEIVRSIDKKHETHTNVRAPLGNTVRSGVDAYRMAKVTDSLSCSAHPSHDFFRFDTPENFPCCYSALVERLHGACAGKDAMVGELQAGTTFYHPNKHTPSPEELKHHIYHSLGRGMKGVIFWEWQSWRSGIFEPGEFSLRASADGAPTERSEAVAETAAVLQKHRAEFAKLRRPSARVAIVESKPSEIYKIIQQHHKTEITELRNEYNHAAYGCFKALYKANIPVDFVSIEQVEAGILANYKTVFLPHVEILGEATAAKLEEFVQDGGWIWADGRFAFLDHGVYLRGEIPGHGLARVFGCKEADFIATRKTDKFVLANGTELTPCQFKQILAPTTGKITATCKDKPVAVRNHYGKGCAELFGAYHCLGIQAAMNDSAMKAQEEAAQKILVDFVRASGVSVRDDITPGFEISRMEGDGMEVHVVTNLNATVTELTLPLVQQAAAVECPQGGATFAGHSIRRQFGPMETALFICRGKTN